MLTTWARIDEATPRLTRGHRAMWVPERIEVTWARHATNGGAWTHWTPTVTVRGYKLDAQRRPRGHYVDLVDITDGEWADHIAALHPESGMDGRPG